MKLDNYVTRAFKIKTDEVVGFNCLRFLIAGFSVIRMFIGIIFFQPRLDF